MKRRWLLIPLLGAVLALGALTGVALAHGGGTNGDSPHGKFVSRVAEILGLDQTQVQGAFDQAKREMQDERVQRHLGALVEKGRLTQEQADEYLQWYQARPQGPLPGLGFHKARRHGLVAPGLRGGLGFGGLRFHGEVVPPTPEPSGATVF